MKPLSFKALWLNSFSETKMKKGAVQHIHFLGICGTAMGSVAAALRERDFIVTGSDGKTTTTSLLAWIFECAGLSPSYMIGGIPRNLGQGACLRDSKYFVIEGDEYDTAFFDKRSKFVHYLPELVIVNNIEFDHADIFDNLDAIKLSFRRLLNIVPTNGMVLLNGDDANCVEVGKTCPAPIVEVGFSPNCGNQIRDARYSSHGSSFVL